MELLEYIWDNLTIRIILLTLIGLITLIVIVLFIIHLKKIKKGQYSKFFWIESEVKEKPNQQQDTTNIIGENINTGTNHRKLETIKNFKIYVRRLNLFLVRILIQAIITGTLATNTKVSKKEYLQKKITRR